MARSVARVFVALLVVSVACAAVSAQAPTTERASVGTGGTQGDAYSSAPSISADGRFVAFQSQASRLVQSDTNNSDDVFVRDRQLGVRSGHNW
jgi:hypothetical protein